MRVGNRHHYGERPVDFMNPEQYLSAVRRGKVGKGIISKDKSSNAENFWQGMGGLCLFPPLGCVTAIATGS